MKRFLLKYGLVAIAAGIMATTVAIVFRYTHYRQPEPPPVEPLPDAVLVYCFHGNSKPKDFDKVESYTKEVVEKSFAEQLQNESLIFKVINYELPENSRLAQEFQVSKATVVIADARPGKSGIARNLQNKIWKLIDNKQAYIDYISQEISDAFK